MGLRGPQPTPTELLEARGSWRAKLNPGEPRPKVGAPACPKGFTKDERAAWKAVCKVLGDMNVLTRADGIALERYVRQLVRWRACESFVAKNGICYPLKADAAKPPTAYIGRLPSGEYVVDWVEYPQVRECHRLHKALKDAEDRFGLSPAARTRIRAVSESSPEATSNGEAESLAAKYDLN
jgi:P27 family predicted phage terminase small subunit